MNKTALNSQKEKHSMLSLRRATSLLMVWTLLHSHFYPRSPCGERLYALSGSTACCSFLSTLSLRRATWADMQSAALKITFLSTLSLRRATLNNAGGQQSQQEFLSTLSLRRATWRFYAFPLFSFHFYPRSPCGERLLTDSFFIAQHHFYPRSPCGERHWARGSRVTYVEFLSTLSLRRATAGVNSMLTLIQISIHALLAESDVEKVPADVFYQAFLSTLSLRRATWVLRNVPLLGIFLSTLSLRRATRADSLAHAPPQFLSTLSLRRATCRISRQGSFPL